jgi:hypothetical protein
MIDVMAFQEIFITCKSQAMAHFELLWGMWCEKWFGSLSLTSNLSQIFPFQTYKSSLYMF